MPTTRKARAPRRALSRVARITLTTEPEHVPVRGNAMASGDDAFDRKVEDGILAQLDNGDEWAWCTVVVRAEYAGLSAETTLGCCSYADEAEFRRGGYYRDMVREALVDLARAIRASRRELSGIRLPRA